MRVACMAAALAAALGVSQGAAVAATATFGAPDAGWNVGIGQPSDEFNLSTSESNIQVGLRSQDYQVGVSANNGMGGDYFVNAGERSLNSGLALWNLDFSISTADARKTIGDFDVKLTIDWDPGVGTDLVSYDFNAVPGVSTLNLLQGSQNLGFPFWNHAFDPFAAGIYVFTLSVADTTGALASTTIRVNVNGVPEPGSLALAGLALAGLVVRGGRSSRGS